MADLKKRILEDIELHPRIWWSYVNDIFFIGEYGENSFKQFIETLIFCHPTIKFTAEWSKEEKKVLRWQCKIWKLETDLHIKPTNTHQFLDSTSCHPYHCKESILYIQALRYNRICSDNENFDQCYNSLNKWLMEKGYSEWLGRKYSKQEVNLKIVLLSKGIRELLRVSITCYSAFQNARSVLEEL